MGFRKQVWFAGAALGAIVAASGGAALAQDVNQTVSGPSSGVVAIGVGAQNVSVTITKKGAVDNPTGTAVTASAQQGNVTVSDAGQVTGASGGILAQTSGPNVSVAVTEGVAGGTGNAVEALDTLGGAASVAIGGGQSAKHPLTISTTGKVGAGAVSVLGDAAISVGDNVAISAGAPGESGAVDVLALGVVTPSDTGGPSAIVTVGKNATLSIQGNGSAAVSAQIGQSGIVGPNGTASTQVTVGDGVAINVSGFNDAGVLGFVKDLTPLGLYAGSGDVSVTVGTGTINVNENGAVGKAAGALTNVGVGAFSAGGDVSISNGANLTVSGGQDGAVGIDAQTAGLGSASVTDRGSITSGGDAVDAFTRFGALSVSVTGGALVATRTGVSATSANGDVDVTVAGAASVTSGGPAISASTEGSLTVAAGGPIVSTGADGIDALGGDGDVTVSIGGHLAAAQTGLLAVSGGGDIAIGAGASSSLAAGGPGIVAESITGSILVDAEGSIAAGGEGVFAQTLNGSVDVNVGGHVTTTSGGDVVEAFASGAGSSTIAVGPGSTLSGGLFGGAVALSLFGPASVSAANNVTVNVGAPGVPGVTPFAAVAVLTQADQGGPSASVAVGDDAHLTVSGNRSAAVSAQIGESAIEGPVNGTASATASVGDGAAINVSGLDVAGVIAFTTDISTAPVYAGFGDASVTVGTGAINVNEVGAIGVSPNFATNIGEGAFSAGGDVGISNGANISVIGSIDLTNGLEAITGGGGSSTITTSGAITVNNGDGVLSQTHDGPNTVTILGGALNASNIGVAATATGAGAVSISVAAGAHVIGGGAGVQAGALAGPVSIDNAGQIGGGVSGGVVANASVLLTVTNESAGMIIGQGGPTSPAIALSGNAPKTLDNSGFIGTQLGDHTGVILTDSGAGLGPGLTIDNEAGGTLDGVVNAAELGGDIVFNNAGVWRTAGFSALQVLPGAASTFNNTGLVQVGQGAGGAPSAAGFSALQAFNNGSATTTGTISMVNGVVGDSFTIPGLFTGAAGHSLLELDVQLGGPGSTADELILQGGSAGQTLIRVNDVLRSKKGALDPSGIVLVQGSSAASSFALDPTQPGFDPATHGIDKGLFTYPLVFTGGDEVLVGEPGLSAHQLATLGAAAEAIWSSTMPGDQSEAHLASSLANGDIDDTGGLHVWAQALNGGPSRLNRGQTLMGRAGFADDPATGGAAPLAGIAAQTASFSAFGTTYGFDTGYAQNVSALITGVDLGRRVGQADAWSWGVSTGYLESQQSFTAGSSIAQYQGALAAVHGAYVTSSGFHVAGDVKMTALQVAYATAWGGGGASTPNMAIDTFGGEADAGWTRSLAEGWTIDPVASLSMQTSRLGAVSIQGTDLRFGDASSVRLGLGARLSGGGRVFGLTWKSQSSVQLWDELRGANTLELASAGPGSLLPDPIGGTFTDASQSFSLESADGRASAFVSGALRWKSDYQAAQLSMGVKLAW